MKQKASPRWCFCPKISEISFFIREILYKFTGPYEKKLSPTHRSFEPKFLIFETKSDFFPIGKNDVTKFPNINNFISPELHLTKF